jgi:ABC-type branched-subunit amino acid transport system substrate-binding protein
MNKFLSFLLVAFTLLTANCFAESIPIGVNLELSGKNSLYGQSVMMGIDLALGEINNTGGINGNIVVLHWKDNQSSADISKTNTEELINQNVWIYGSGW